MISLQDIKTPPALKLLNRLQLKASIRAFKTKTFTLTGLYAVLIIVFFIAPFAIEKKSLLFWYDKMFFIFGASALTFISLLSMRSGLTGTVFYFSAAETQFLMTGPISHLTLITYKFKQYVVGAIGISLLLALHLATNLLTFTLYFSQTILIILFILGLPILISSTKFKGIKLIKIGFIYLIDFTIWLLLIAAISAIAFRLAGDAKTSFYFTYLFRQIVYPFDLFWQLLFFSQDPLSTVRLFIVNLVLYSFCLYRSPLIEIESIFYKNKEQQNRFQNKFKGSKNRTPIFCLPDFPYFNGLGPVLWQRLTLSIRTSFSNLIIKCFIIIAYIAMTLFLLKSFYNGDGTGLQLWHLFYISIVLGQITLAIPNQQDFRSEADKIELFLSYPISTTKWAIGMILPTTLKLFLFTILLNTIGFFLYRHVASSHASIILFATYFFTTFIISLFLILIAFICFIFFPVQSDNKTKFMSKLFEQSAALYLSQLAGGYLIYILLNRNQGQVSFNLINIGFLHLVLLCLILFFSFQHLLKRFPSQQH